MRFRFWKNFLQIYYLLALDQEQTPVSKQADLLETDMPEAEMDIPSPEGAQAEDENHLIPTNTTEELTEE